MNTTHRARVVEHMDYYGVVTAYYAHCYDCGWSSPRVWVTNEDFRTGAFRRVAKMAEHDGKLHARLQGVTA